MASLPPEATKDFTPEQISTLYPSDLALQYVQIFFRHGTPQTSLPSHATSNSNSNPIFVIGERTPVRQRLASAGIPSLWDVCTAADEFRSTALLPTGQFHSLHYRRKVEIPGTNGRLENPNRMGERCWYAHAIFYELGMLIW